MPSSISSSSDRLPGGAWRVTWAAALLLVALVVAGWEMTLRARGLEIASVVDNPTLWARERERVALLGDNALALVGASQMQMSIDLPTLRRHTSATPVQLGISAAPFMPVLASLADDERVSATVIVAFTMNDFVSHTRDTPSDLWARHYRNTQVSAAAVYYRDLEQALREVLGKVFVFVRSGARPQQALFGRAAGYVRTLPDRTQQADYLMVDRDAAYERRVARYLSGKEASFREVPDFEQRRLALESMITRIQQRGGHVVLVRFPTGKRILQMDQILYPKEIYWDQISRQSSARTIHFAEHPSLAGFDLPDGVHMDYRDTPAFTQALARLLYPAPEVTADP